MLQQTELYFGQKNQNKTKQTGLNLTVHITVHNWGKQYNAQQFHLILQTHITVTKGSYWRYRYKYSKYLRQSFVSIHSIIDGSLYVIHQVLCCSADHNRCYWTFIALCHRNTTSSSYSNTCSNVYFVIPTTDVVIISFTWQVTTLPTTHDTFCWQQQQYFTSTVPH